ncbi:hypothetical protein E5Q_02307 [Mixia osmundae IAM 14324]|uniref:Glycerol transporter n=1 Tax=Mixia osmundae (strain CBS 9802 / IAM 14324 / JCM 22182 / KY 12970) TaxID=764103 RepID=G7DYJ3_MIXOS|nr:hypothetical protein E5Q_02307 [Mixia osmundae IAM 14324]
MTVTVPPSTKRNNATLLADEANGLPLRQLTTPDATRRGKVPIQLKDTVISSDSLRRTRPRWRTPEYILYSVIVTAAVLQMTRVAMRLSRPEHPNYAKYAGRLSPGWMTERVDNSDHQYSTFRNSFAALVVLAVIWGVASRLFARRQLARMRSSASRLSAPDRLPFLLPATAAFLLLFHGFSVLFLAILVTTNYLVATRTAKSKFGVVAVWGFNIGTLFLNDMYGGYKFASLHTSLAWMDSNVARGLVPRWQLHHNITMLRLVSFSLDYRWAISAYRRDETGAANGTAKLSGISSVATSHAPAEYNFYHYLAYAFYPPLYIAGPIMTYNDFVAQLKLPPKLPRRETISYAVRFAVSLLTMEWVLHNIYVVAIKSEEGGWAGDTPFEVSMIGFWNLIIVWLKLLLPWRFFRLWALTDGIDPPENMVRCMANNYSTLGFWRSWHRSFNLWIIRYIYIPIGGNKNMIPATLLVFTFVAMWHDLSLQLLTWGWVVALFILPEVLAKRAVPERKYESKWWYRHVAAAGGVANILMMMTANLIGFAIGVDGIKYLGSQVFGTFSGRSSTCSSARLLNRFAGYKFLALACIALYSATHLMFEYRRVPVDMNWSKLTSQFCRAEEVRRGIVRKC